MKLTPALLDHCPVYHNGIHQDTIDISKKGILDANIGCTNDIYRCIDLQHNIMTSLIVPAFDRLTTLLLSHSKLTSVHIKAPYLDMLSLNHNQLSDIANITIDSHQLATLTLHHNPIATDPNYAAIVMKAFPSVKTLDYHKVAKVTPSTYEPDQQNDQLATLKKQLLEAKTMDEVQQIEKLILEAKK